MFSTFILSLLIGLATPTTQPVVTEELYHVLFVQGQILNKTSGAMLLRGDKLKATDKVVFRSKDGKAVVLSNTRGRFVMSANPSQVGSELADVVGNIVSPLKTNSKLSTRGGEVEGEDKVKDFKAHFGKTENNVVPTYLIIGDKYEFKVDKGALKFETDESVAISYKSTDNKKGLKGLGAKEDGKIALGKETFAGKVDVSKLSVVEFRKWNKTTSKIDETPLASFRPVFIDAKELAASFKEYLGMTNVNETLAVYMANNKDALAKLPKMTSTEKKRELLFYFLSECYGTPSENGEVDVNTVKVDEHLLTKWLTDNKL